MVAIMSPIRRRIGAPTGHMIGQGEDRQGGGHQQGPLDRLDRQVVDRQEDHQYQTAVGLIRCCQAILIAQLQLSLHHHTEPNGSNIDETGFLERGPPSLMMLK